MQVPRRAFPGAISNSGLVVNGAFDHNEIRLLGDINGIAGAKLNIGLATYPGFTRANVDYESADRRSSLQVVEGIAPLRERGAFCQRIICGRAERTALLLRVADQLCAILFLNFANFGALENGAIRICIGAEATGARDYIAQMFSGFNAISSGMHDFAIDLDRCSYIFPSGNLANREHIARA